MSEHVDAITVPDKISSAPKTEKMSISCLLESHHGTHKVSCHSVAELLEIIKIQITYTRHIFTKIFLKVKQLARTNMTVCTRIAGPVPFSKFDWQY